MSVYRMEPMTREMRPPTEETEVLPDETPLSGASLGVSVVADDGVGPDPHLAFEASMDGMALLGPDETYAYMNRAHAELYGYRPAELLGQSWRVLYTPEEIARFEETYMPELIDTGHWRGEVTGRRRDGSPIETEVSLTLIAEGGLVCVCRDITERKRSERALAENEQSFRLLFASNPVPMFLFDRETHRFLAVNDAAVSHYGYSRGEFLGMTVDQIRPADLNQRLHREAAEPSSVWNEDERRYWRHAKKSGEVIDVEIVTNDLLFAGREARLVLATDVTKRLAAEGAIRQYAARLEALQDLERAILSARSPKDIADGALRHIQRLIPANRASVVLFDFEHEMGEILAARTDARTSVGGGRRLSISQFHVSDDLRRGNVYEVPDIQSVEQRHDMLDALEAEGIRSYISVPLIVREDLMGQLNLGSRETGGFSLEQIEIAREVADQLAIAIQEARLHDQVEAHASELERRVAERTAELEAFSYSVSHDLRTPLRAIDGFSRIVLEDYEDLLDDEGKRLLGVIRSNTRNMGNLIDGLLAFSRLGRRQMEIQPVDMTELAREVWAELEEIHFDRHFRFEMVRMPPTRGDRAMLRQVFVNLLSNALKFTRRRRVAQIELGAEEHDDEVTYWVKDNGVGFEPRYMSKLFGVFQRLHTGSEFEGTGVGLAIVHRIVTRHCGRITAESSVGEGARFAFTLPRYGPAGKRPCG